MPNETTYRMFAVTFLGPTNTKGSRLRITDLRYGKSIVLSKSYEYDDIKQQAVKYLKDELGINITARAWCEVKGTDYLMTTNFDTQLSKVG
jgi:hypothetical protein